MLGLSHRVSKNKVVSKGGLDIVWFVLLHRGSQAGDPAILLKKPKSAVLPIQSIQLYARARDDGHRQQGRLVLRIARGRGRQVVGTVKLTWPSRVPLRISCSAILKSSSMEGKESTKSRSGGSNGFEWGNGRVWLSVNWA